MSATYLTYAEYQTLCLGEAIPEALFNKLVVKASLKLDYFTNNRVADLKTVPDEVKFSVAEFVDILAVVNDNGALGLSSYSNGIESISYAIDVNNPERSINTIMWNRLKENLSKYPELIYRGVSCG